MNNKYSFLEYSTFLNNNYAFLNCTFQNNNDPFLAVVHNFKEWEKKSFHDKDKFEEFQQVRSRIIIQSLRTIAWESLTLLVMSLLAIALDKSSKDFEAFTIAWVRTELFSLWNCNDSRIFKSISSRPFSNSGTKK